MQKIKASDLPCPTESQEQQTLFRFCSVELSRYPELEMLAHIPNEGKRTKSTGGRLNKEVREVFVLQKKRGVEKRLSRYCFEYFKTGVSRIILRVKAETWK